MIVYGDHPEEVAVADQLAALARQRLEVMAQPPGIARHAGLATLFIEVGRLIQGIADARFEALGEDRSNEGVDRLMAHAGLLGAALMMSWDSGFTSVAAVPPLPLLTDVPERVTLKQPEGYAFYALHPEAYAVAARRLQLDGSPRVIGIRSIGTALSALVAATLGAPTPFTVRPVGHPFARQLRIAPAAVAALVVPDAHYIVVDEGPGLSGSSFAAVADFLAGNGVPRSRIAFLPSHAGDPGGEASDACHLLWREVQRVSAPVEEVLPIDRLGKWLETLVGPLAAPLEVVSGGRWRTLVGHEDWPADPAREPLKFLARAVGQRWLVKFLGLGVIGQRKLERAKDLAAAGLIPKPVGLAYGFIVQQWVDAETGIVPTVAQVAHYLATRRRALAPPRRQGASSATLFDMARINITEALGDAAGLHFQLNFAPEEWRITPMSIDGRMDRYKWLRLPDGTVLKADALDHDADHDLIGPQDIAWDVAGAIVELDLDEQALVAALGMAGVALDDRLLRFLKPCYLAYRIGHANRAAGSAGTDSDRASQASRLARYRVLLEDVLVSA
nr:hypothetical protein [Polymorphobacter sp.]